MAVGGSVLDYGFSLSGSSKSFPIGSLTELAVLAYNIPARRTYTGAKVFPAAYDATMRMNIPGVYLVSFVSAIVALTLWRIWRLMSAATRRAAFAWLRRRFVYALLYRRRQSTSEFNVLQALKLGVLTLCNGAACVLGVSDHVALAGRCASLFIVNTVPLYMGGRTNLFVDRILRISLGEYYFLHRWLGRICVVQGLIHGTISALISKSPITPVEGLLMGLLAALGLLSIVPIRSRMHELFQKTHLTFALGLVACLWYHTHIGKNKTTFALATMGGLWVLNHLVWVVRLSYRNLGVGSSVPIAITKFIVNPADYGGQAMDVTIHLKRPWKAIPGQYIYLTLPGLSKHKAGFGQSHPYVIAWAENSEIRLLIQRLSGFSESLFTSPSDRLSPIIDGPYGSASSLGDYDKVLFVANGIGISAHLLAIKHLIESHNNQSSRVRRLTLLWFIESAGQEEWAEEYLHRLAHADDRNVFTLALYVPIATSKPPVRISERCYRTCEPLDLTWFIQNEASAEAGNMALSVCASPHFEEAVRHAVCASDKDIHLIKSVFAPDDTTASLASRCRYY